MDDLSCCDEDVHNGYVFLLVFLICGDKVIRRQLKYVLIENSECIVWCWRSVLHLYGDGWQCIKISDSMWLCINTEIKTSWKKMTRDTGNNIRHHVRKELFSVNTDVFLEMWTSTSLCLKDLWKILKSLESKVRKDSCIVYHHTI